MYKKNGNLPSTVPQAVVAPKKAIAAFFMLAFLAFVGIFNKELFTGHPLEISIKEIYAVAHCSKARFRFTRGTRSSVPKPIYTSFCGVVETNFGAFELPYSNEIWPSYESRTDLLKKLKVGCSYNVKIVGYGVVAKEGDLPRDPTPQTIMTATKTGECA